MRFKTNFQVFRIHESFSDQFLIQVLSTFPSEIINVCQKFGRKSQLNSKS